MDKMVVKDIRKDTLIKQHWQRGQIIGHILIKHYCKSKRPFSIKSELERILQVKINLTSSRSRVKKGQLECVFMQKRSFDSSLAAF